VHLGIYLALDQTFDLDAIGEDIAKRPYITVGFAAFVTLLPLAITSTRGWMRRLGKRWQALHRLTYVAGVLAVVHYYWEVKLDVSLPLAFGVIVAVLLGARLAWAIGKRRPVRAGAPQAAFRDPSKLQRSSGEDSSRG
jgi:sulfoxide reductase heme-binding subunit YedZ